MDDAKKDDVPDDEGPTNLMNIVVTGMGAWPVEGLAVLGSKRAIPFALFSANWMKPATMGDGQKLKKYLKDKAAQPAK